MKPLLPAVVVPGPFSQFYAMCAKEGISMERAKEIYEKESDVESWRNELYVVCVFYLENGVTHLSIRRVDRAPMRDWRHFQQIKNQLCGVEREAVEIYPAESRVMDAANQYHLWVLPADEIVPLGFPTGGKRDEYDADFNGKQRPFELEEYTDAVHLI